MSLGSDYQHQDCPVARSLEIVGERWTLLIVRDLFLGLRRYTDLRKHIGLSPAVLTQRLNGLVEEGVVARVPGLGAHDEYELTPKGERLWPVLCALAQWGNENYMAPDRRQLLFHSQCGTPLDGAGMCERCKVVPTARDVVMRPRPPFAGDDAGSTRTRGPLRLLDSARR